MCDSFLGEGKVGVKSGVQVSLQVACRRNPSLPLRAFQPHPSRWGGNKKNGNRFSKNLLISSSNVVVRAYPNVNCGNKGAWQNPRTITLFEHHLPFKCPTSFMSLIKVYNPSDF